MMPSANSPISSRMANPGMGMKAGRPSTRPSTRANSPCRTAPGAVGEYVAENIPGARLVRLDARGHCPNLSAPEELAAAIAESVG